MDGYAITAVTAFHSNIGSNAFNGNAFATSLGRVKPNSIGKSVATIQSFSKDVDIACIRSKFYSSIFACKNTYWAGNVIFHLDLQARVSGNIRNTVFGVNTCKYVVGKVALSFFTKSNYVVFSGNGFYAVINGVNLVAIVFPLQSVRIISFFSFSKFKFYKLAFGDNISANNIPSIKFVVQGAGSKILSAQADGVFRTVSIDVQLVTNLYPYTFGVVFCI